jgi:hypothetical protein
MIGAAHPLHALLKRVHDHTQGIVVAVALFHIPPCLLFALAVPSQGSSPSTFATLPLAMSTKATFPFRRIPAGLN